MRPLIKYNMKKVLLFFVLIIFCSNSAYSQGKPVHKKQQNYYKKKSSSVKKTNLVHKNGNSKPSGHGNSGNFNVKTVPAIVKKSVNPANSQVVNNNNFSVLAVDANTGEVLFAKNAHEYRYPASLTKLMTLYVVFDLLDRDRISLSDKIRFSKNAALKPRMKLGVQAGDYITVREAIDSLIVLSANDVAAAVAEHIGGSEAEFAKIMTRKAKALKMYKTTFNNASGLFHPTQRTTAADMVKLGIALRQDFPQYYKYFSKTSFNFRGRDINGHNSITANYPGAEGLKTGYISQSGYNLISSASREKKTIFAAVMGGKTSKERDSYMRKLLDASFVKAGGRARL